MAPVMMAASHQGSGDIMLPPAKLANEMQNFEHSVHRKSVDYWIDVELQCLYYDSLPSNLVKAQELRLLLYFNLGPT